MKALEIRALSKSFGGLSVLRNVELAVEPGERRAIIGPNGAGKTTLFNLICGTLKPCAGEILIFGKPVTSLPPYRRSRLGLARTFQRNNLFVGLSLLDNLKLAMRDNKSSLNPCHFFHKWGLFDKLNTRVAELSYGEQRQAEILLALAQSPKLILLDEPTAGMSSVERAIICDRISKLPPEVTVLMIEHDMEVVFDLADRITVLHLGEVLFEGGREEVKAHPRVKEIYLGEASEE